MFYIFLTILNILFVGLYFFPLIFNQTPLYETHDLEITEYIFIYVIISLKISLIYIFISKKIYHLFQLKTYIINFFILIVSILLIFIILKVVNIKTHDLLNHYLFYSNVFTFIFYSFNFVMIHISNIILKQRNVKMIRKLSIFEDEVENLYNFVKSFKSHEYNLYEYQNLMKYVNSFIVEKNNKILASINLIQIDTIYIVFDFFSYDVDDLYLLIHYILKHLNKNITMLIFDFPNNYSYIENENLIHQHILEILNLQEHWIDSENINTNESLLFFINEYINTENYNDYILKKFYNNLLHNFMEHKISKFKKMSLQ